MNNIKRFNITDGYFPQGYIYRVINIVNTVNKIPIKL